MALPSVGTINIWAVGGSQVPHSEATRGLVSPSLPSLMPVSAGTSRSAGALKAVARQWQ